VRHTRGIFQVYEVDGYNGYGIEAVTYSDARVKNITAGTAIFREADAHLFAAAPEILECIEQYLLLYTELVNCKTNDEKRSVLDSMVSLRKRMIAARAKARGES